MPLNMNIQRSMTVQKSTPLTEQASGPLSEQVKLYIILALAVASVDTQPPSTVVRRYAAH